jgi:type VI secretion system protein ImpL
MDDFFSKNLAAQVDMSGASGAGGIPAMPRPACPQEVLNQFQRAARVRDMFFAGGGRQPSLRFELTPQATDPALSKLVLDIDGQQVVSGPACLRGRSDHAALRAKAGAWCASRRRRRCAPHAQ